MIDINSKDIYMKRNKSAEVLAYIILFLSTTDAVNTIILIEHFDAAEVNPILSAVMNHYGYSWFFLIKTGLIVSGVGILITLNRTWPLKYITALFTALIGYQFHMMVVGV